jgi:ribosomal protein L37E
MWRSPLVQEKYQEEKTCDKVSISNKNNNNNNNNKYILKQPDTDELCRRCGEVSETIQHITETCGQLAFIEYVNRHDRQTKINHQKLAEAAEIIDNKRPYYKYTRANIQENESFKLYWNRSILILRNQKL